MPRSTPFYPSTRSAASAPVSGRITRSMRRPSATGQGRPLMRTGRRSASISPTIRTISDRPSIRMSTWSPTSMRPSRRAGSWSTISRLSGPSQTRSAAWRRSRAGRTLRRDSCPRSALWSPWRMQNRSTSWIFASSGRRCSSLRTGMRKTCRRSRCP